MPKRFTNCLSPYSAFISGYFKSHYTPGKGKETLKKGAEEWNKIKEKLDRKPSTSMAFHLGLKGKAPPKRKTTTAKKTTATKKKTTATKKKKNEGKEEVEEIPLQNNKGKKKKEGDLPARMSKEEKAMLAEKLKDFRDMKKAIKMSQAVQPAQPAQPVIQNSNTSMEASGLFGRRGRGIVTGYGGYGGCW